MPRGKTTGATTSNERRPLSDNPHLLLLALDRERYLARRREIEDEIRQRQDPRRLLKLLTESASFANQAVFAFQNGSHEKKRDIAMEVFSNCWLQAKTLRIEAKKPFGWFAKSRDFSTMSG